MQKLVIIIFICLIGFGVYRYIAGDNPIVAYGEQVFSKESALTDVDLYGEFVADKYIENGQPTIFDFYTDNCKGCKILDGHLNNFLAIRDDVIVRKIRLDTYWQPDDILENHKIDIGSTPHIIIYNPEGKLVAEDKGQDKSGFDFLYAWMNDEIQMDFKKRQKK